MQITEILALMAIVWGPCCFCGQSIEKTDTDPCEVRVTTAEGPQKSQVWFCHGQCFRDRLGPPLMKPVPDFSTQHTFNQRRLRRATIYIEVSDVGG